MNDQLTPKTTHSSDQPRRPWRRRLVLATLVGGLAAGIGATALAHGGPGGWHGGWGGGRGWHGEMDPQAMQRRAEAMVKWWLADVDATDAQQKQVAEIMTTTMRELAPLREKHRAARKQVVEILSKPQIDRAALESSAPRSCSSRRPSRGASRSRLPTRPKSSRPTSARSSPSGWSAGTARAGADERVTAGAAAAWPRPLSFGPRIIGASESRD